MMRLQGEPKAWQGRGASRSREFTSRVARALRKKHLRNHGASQGVRAARNGLTQRRPGLDGSKRRVGEHRYHLGIVN